jgi:hypothetical protein
VSVVSGNAPSSINTVAETEYLYSLTADTTAWQTLNDFIVNNWGSSFDPRKVLSLSIMNDDEFRDLVWDGLRWLSKTVLKADKYRSVTRGEWQDYPIKDKFFGEFTFQSDATVTITWEQAEI